MDYEKLYKESLERAKKFQKNSKGMILKKWLWGVFPELKESENERIRKNCIHFLELQKSHHASTVEIEECIAWLEKQGEQEHGDTENDCYCNREQLKYTLGQMIGFWASRNGKDYEENDLMDYVRVRMSDVIKLFRPNACLIDLSDCSDEYRNAYYDGYNKCNRDLLEKQGESDETKAKKFLVKKGYPIDANGSFPTYEEMYSIIREGLEKQGEHCSELKENEEGIKKDIMVVLETSATRFFKEHGKMPAWYDEAIAWLEPQSKMPQGKSTFEAGNEETDDVNKFEQEQSPYEATVKAIADMCGKDTYSNGSDLQDFYNNVKVKCKEAIEFDEIQKPKFKVGDWVVDNHGKVNQVISVNEYGDGYTLDDDCYFSGSWCKDYHLWTIQDAKSGDLIYVSTEEQGIQAIFDKFDNGIIYFHCSLCRDFTQGGYMPIGDVELAYPLQKTHYQRFFQKMKEAGYKWHSDKKELVKLDEPTQSNDIWHSANEEPDKDKDVLVEWKWPNMEKNFHVRVKPFVRYYFENRQILRWAYNEDLIKQGYDTRRKR